MDGWRASLSGASRGVGGERSPPAPLGSVSLASLGWMLILHDSMVKAKTQRRLPMTEWEKLVLELRLAWWLIVGPLAVMWVLEIMDALLLGGSLDRFGIRPREPAGLLGIITAPFLHGGFPHLFTNSVSFMLFGGMLAMRGIRRFIWATLAIILVSGLGVWLLGGSGSNHIGASGLIFGYFAYVLTAGLFERRLGVALVSVTVLLLWGFMILGVLPGQHGISWEGHLFGFLGGVGTARLHAPLGGRLRGRRS